MATGTAALEGFSCEHVVHYGKARDVYRTGSGPAVIVIAEIPGITPAVAGFGRAVAAAGFTAVLPHLFGDPGATPTGLAVARSLIPACISREFSTLALHRTSPVTRWLRSLARAEHALRRPGGGRRRDVPHRRVRPRHDGRRDGGGARAQPAVAPVPGLATPQGRPRHLRRRSGPGEGTGGRGACVLGLRFTGDTFSPPERFDRLRRELGDGFVAVELDSSPDNPHGHPRRAHSVLTEHLDDRPGTPTRAALGRVLAFFAERLLSPA